MKTRSHVVRHFLVYGSICSFLLVVCLLSPTACVGQSTSFELAGVFLNPSPGSSGEIDSFGTRFVQVLDNVLIGAMGEDFAPANDAGVIHLFDGKTQTLIRTIPNPFPSTGDYFGSSLAWLRNNVVVVGAYRDDTTKTNSGTVYVLDAQTSEIIHILRSPNPTTDGYFGYWVSTSQGRILVGAPGDTVAGAPGGAAYVFDGLTGSHTLTIPNPTPDSGDQFGFNLQLANYQAVIGARYDDVSGADAGVAYLFDIQTGDLRQTYLNPEPDPQDWFGISVFFVGEDVLVGSMGDDTVAVEGGSAYLFDKSTAALVRTLRSPSPSSRGYFGSAVTSFHNFPVVGEPFHSPDNPQPGAAHVFDAATGDLVQSFTNPNPPSVGRDNFGHYVGWFGLDGILIGAHRDPTVGAEAGAVYYYVLPQAADVESWLLYQ